MHFTSSGYTCTHPSLTLLLFIFQLSFLYRYHAERSIGLAKIYKSLKTHHENQFERPWLKPSPFLISIVEAQSSVREEMHFMKEQEKAKAEAKAIVIAKAVAKAEAVADKKEAQTQ